METFLEKAHFDILRDHSFRLAARQGKTSGSQGRNFIEGLRSEVLLTGDPYTDI
jgi:hypothetical protein